MSEYDPSDNLRNSQAIGASTLASPGASNACSLAPTNSSNVAKLGHMTVSAGQVTTVANGTLTITGLSVAVGSTLNYIFVETVSAGGYVDLYFDPPLPASGAGVSIVATLAAISGGSSSAITLTGWQA